MPELEVERAARFLATHAVLLLGLVIAAGAAALVAIVAIIRAVDRFRVPIQRRYAWLRHDEPIANEYSNRLLAQPY